MTSHTPFSQVPEGPGRSRKSTADELQIRDLNSPLLAQWETEFQSTLEQHKLEGKISSETVAEKKRFQRMANVIINVVGADGHKNFKECLWAKRYFDDSVSLLSGTIEASDFVEDCLRVLQYFLETYPLHSLAEEVQGRHDTPDPDESLKQTFHPMRKSRMNRAEALRHEFLAIMRFSEQCDRYAERLKDRSPPSPELEWLAQYSEAKGRSTGQGKGYSSLFIRYLIDHSDPNSASFTPDMIEKTKFQIRITRSSGRWFSTLYRQFGPGVFCNVRGTTKTA